MSSLSVRLSPFTILFTASNALTFPFLACDIIATASIVSCDSITSGSTPSALATVSLSLCVGGKDSNALNVSLSSFLRFLVCPDLIPPFRLIALASSLLLFVTGIRLSCPLLFDVLGLFWLVLAVFLVSLMSLSFFPFWLLFAISRPSFLFASLEVFKPLFVFFAITPFCASVLIFALVARAYMLSNSNHARIPSLSLIDVYLMQCMFCFASSHLSTNYQMYLVYQMNSH